MKSSKTQTLPRLERRPRRWPPRAYVLITWGPLHFLCDSLKSNAGWAKGKRSLLLRLLRFYASQRFFFGFVFFFLTATCTHIFGSLPERKGGKCTS